MQEEAFHKQIVHIPFNNPEKEKRPGKLNSSSSSKKKKIVPSPDDFCIR